MLGEGEYDGSEAAAPPLPTAGEGPGVRAAQAPTEATGMAEGDRALRRAVERLWTAIEERQDEIVARVRALVEDSGGTWTGHEPWGRRRLAYEIQHKQDGVYHLVTFDATRETLDEVARVLRITEGVMRFMPVRRETVPNRAEPAPADRPREYAATNVRSEAEEG